MLELDLHPLLPTRRSVHGGATVPCGFGLRLPGGFAVDEDDPLLANFGVVVAAVSSEDGFEALQGDDFAPGATVRVLAGIDDSDAVSVWSADGVRLAGSVLSTYGEQLAAAVAIGVPLRAVVLSEWAHLGTGARTGIEVLVGPAAAFSAHVPDVTPLRPARTARPRLVLIADGQADLALWDPAGGHGPLEADQVGVSPEVLARVDQLREAFADRRGEEVSVGLDRVFAGWEDEALVDETKALWRRLRAELGRRCDVGYLGPGMERPAWDPAEVEDDDEDDGIPF